MRDRQSQWCFTGSEDGTVCIWDAESGVGLTPPLKGHNDYVTSVAFSPDGRRVVSGSDNHIIRVWDANTSNASAIGGTSVIMSVTFSDDGTRIVTSSDIGDDDWVDSEARTNSGQLRTI